MILIEALRESAAGGWPDMTETCFIQTVTSDLC